MALEKAVITNTVSGERTAVMFNPEEYTLSKGVNFAQTGVPGLSAPILQFVSGALQTLELELLLDTYEEHRAGSRSINQAHADVRPLVRQITGLMDIEPSTHAPPVLLFTWASLSFTCVLAQARQRYVLFNPDGTPIRARLSVTFNEFCNVELEAREVKRETADYTKIYEVSQGESLRDIAWRSYGSPALWRPIALRNGIDDPRALAAGARLVVPQLPYRDPESGEVYA